MTEKTKTDADSSVYEPKAYWTRVLGRDPSLREVGYPDLPESFNRYLYRAMARAVMRALVEAGLDRRLDRATVCDIGCGSGAWVEFWRHLGAADVAGLDLTRASIDHLKEKYPGFEFYEADISEPSLPLHRQFDVVSAMSVLLHIKDDGRFRQAIGNIATLLSPGGALLVIDPVITRRWWGRPFDATANSKARHIDEWRQVLRKNGLVVTDLRPVTALLANPADTGTKLTFDALSIYWQALSLLVRRGERIGNVVGRAAFLVDAFLLRLLKEGPSTKLLIAHRVSG